MKKKIEMKRTCKTCEEKSEKNMLKENASKLWEDKIEYDQMFRLTNFLNIVIHGLYVSRSYFIQI